jgi:uncharacterized protein YjbI with pentapeptide repeats
MIMMTLSGWKDREAAREAEIEAELDSLLAVARRETLVLAIAAGVGDDDAGAVASARLRWAIGAARPLIAPHADPPDTPRDRRAHHRAAQLDRIANRAQRWFADQPARSLPAVGAIVDRLAVRRDHRAAADPGTLGAISLIGGLDASHGHLVDLDLDDLELHRIVLYGAGLTEITARRARLDAADARATRWVRCELEASSLATAVLTGATLDRCELGRANLEASSWHRTAVAHSQLVRATLIDARLDRAVFSECNLRGADLQIVRTPDVASLAGARFVRCDLRETNWRGRELGGATFVDCKLFGAHGAASLAGAVIERPDISLLGDGSKIAAPAEVAAAWPTMIGAPAIA